MINGTIHKNEKAAITRRFALAGIATGAAVSLLGRPLEGDTSPSIVASIFVVIPKPTTGLFMADMYGTQSGTSLGCVLACPQSCASSRGAAYDEASTNQTLKDIYLKTTEWMREIIYTDDYRSDIDPAILRQNFRLYRNKLGFTRVTNDPNAGRLRVRFQECEGDQGKPG